MNSNLYHHGILGQKWGVRRYQNSDGTLTETGKSRYKNVGNDKEKEARKKAVNQKKNDVKNRSTFSTEELQKKIDRLKMEKQLRELTSEEVAPGRSAVIDVLSSIGSKVIKTAATGAILYGMKAVASKDFKAKEFGDAIFNGGAKKK